MSFVIGILTFILVVNCVFLILLVLVQLPKKDAGAGLAFGGGATDALFGAGSGTALTKITKYAAGVFFALALLLAVLQSNRADAGPSELERELSKQPAPADPSPGLIPPAVPIVTNPVTAPPAESPAAPETPATPDK